MGIEADIANIKTKIDKTIFEVLYIDVATAIRDEMSRHLESYTYTRSRGPKGWGVRDRRNFDEKVEQDGDKTVLKVTDIAEYQDNVFAAISLAEAVESGAKSLRMPYPRPFLAPTQQIMDSGEAERVFADGLRGRGL